MELAVEGEKERVNGASNRKTSQYVNAANKNNISNQADASNDITENHCNERSETMPAVKANAANTKPRLSIL